MNEDSESNMSEITKAFLALSISLGLIILLSYFGVFR